MTQNPVPFQLLSRNSTLESLVAYCSRPDPRLWRGEEYVNKGTFDLPALEGYRSTFVRNWSPLPRLGKFWGLFNPGVIPLVAKADCVVVFGHSYASFLLAILTAKLLRKPLLLSTDATYLESPDGGRRWKSWLKRKLLPFLYNRVASGVLVPSTLSRRFLLSLGAREERVFLTPYVVDNESIARAAAATNRDQVRDSWDIPRDAVAVVFCGKFIARKRAADLLQAFAGADVPDSFLVLVGDGPLRADLEGEARRLGIEKRTRFLGLVKYSELPAVYASCDLLVHPAEHEPYGLPVNEAMICGIPTVVSDRVGAGLDLVRHGETGFVYASGDVPALTVLLRDVLPRRAFLKELGARAVERMKTWSPRENADGTADAIEHVLR